ncbi:SpnB-like Rossmann fold domain-containing protein [Streptomyces sp. 8N616]|uniref:SpnB-like Rossmann fold domain-containing protein n=1 Tax=Streptomyces sp. 8N616 TaxID=3457414 RepID=UPI003FD19D13
MIHHQAELAGQHAVLASADVPTDTDRVGGERFADLGCAALWGLVHSAQAENPDRIVLVDVEDTALFTDAVAAVLACEEPQAARDGKVLAPRLEAVAPVAAAGPVPDPDGTVLVTGATDFVLIRHLIARGARHLTVVAGLPRARTCEPMPVWTPVSTSTSFRGTAPTRRGSPRSSEDCPVR